MPFKSDAQRKFMYAEHPKIAKRWSREENKMAYGGMPMKGSKSDDKKKGRQDAISRRLKMVVETKNGKNGGK